MKLASTFPLAIGTVLFILASASVLGASTNTTVAKDPRYCGPPQRDADGSIHRSVKAKDDFAKLYPCPLTGKAVPSCKGWSIDHVIPLACGGCDEPSNMQWLPLSIKSCANDGCKDRWERRVYQTTIPCK